MTPERWKRTEELYQAARSRPPGERAAFLAVACRDDESLRRDVESLVNETDSADGFLAESPIAHAAQIVRDFAPAVLASPRGVPRRLVEAGFEFLEPTIEAGLRAAVTRSAS